MAVGCQSQGDADRRFGLQQWLRLSERRRASARHVSERPRCAPNLDPASVHGRRCRPSWCWPCSAFSAATDAQRKWTAKGKERGRRGLRRVPPCGQRTTRRRIGDAKGVVCAGLCVRPDRPDRACAGKGIRNMPAARRQCRRQRHRDRARDHLHGQPVRGHWVEPVGGATPAVAHQRNRSSCAQCATCHGSGAGRRAEDRRPGGLDPETEARARPAGRFGSARTRAVPARGGDFTDLATRRSAARSSTCSATACRPWRHPTRRSPRPIRITRSSPGPTSTSA